MFHKQIHLIFVAKNDFGCKVKRFYSNKQEFAEKSIILSRLFVFLLTKARSQ